MAYIGAEPRNNFASLTSQQITGTGTSAYALNHQVSVSEDLEVYVNEVRQNPNTYTISNNGYQLNLGASISGSDTCYVVYQAQTLEGVSPMANSVQGVACSPQFFQNNQQTFNDLTLPENRNCSLVGTITVAANNTITVPSTSTLVII